MSRPGGQPRHVQVHRSVARESRSTYLRSPRHATTSSRSGDSSSLVNVAMTSSASIEINKSGVQIRVLVGEDPDEALEECRSLPDRLTHRSKRQDRHG